MLAAQGGRLPPKCTRMDEFGNLPTCTQVQGGGWDVSYPSGPTPGESVGGGMALLFVLALVAGLAFTIWKVSTARRMARDSGMSEGDATAMALLTDEGFEATYLASNLRGEQSPPGQPVARAAVAERLTELERLRAEGLVSDDEYAAARDRILGEL